MYLHTEATSNTANFVCVNTVRSKFNAVYAGRFNGTSTIMQVKNTWKTFTPKHNNIYNMAYVPQWRIVYSRVRVELCKYTNYILLIDLSIQLRLIYQFRYYNILLKSYIVSPARIIVCKKTGKYGSTYIHKICAAFEDDEAMKICDKAINNYYN